MLQKGIIPGQVFSKNKYPGFGQKTAEKILKQKIKQQRAVVKLGNWALQGYETRVLVDETVKLVSSILNPSFTTIVEFDRINRRYVLQAEIGIDKRIIHDKFLDISKRSQTLYTIKRKKPVILKDSTEEKRFDVNPWLIRNKLKSSMSVVIEGDRVPFGVL